VIYLVASIVLTSYLTLSFKALERLGIPVLPSIVFNYWTCVLVGSMVNGVFPISAEMVQQPWAPWALLMGTVFISLFNLIAFITQRIGVAVASVANKLSLVIPFIFSLYLYNETATPLKIAGILVALAGVIATCWPAKKDEANPAPKTSIVLILLLPAILFLGSGLLDTMINYVEHQYLGKENSNDFLISAFFVAAVLGTILMIYLLAVKKTTFRYRTVLAGIAIGIPNYFSIWCLVRVLREYVGKSSAIIPVNNMGIVLFSAIVAWLVFREKLSAINWVGIFLSLVAISLIAFG
jgi:drug/metabolite transporter (DMT)-like permease